MKSRVLLLMAMALIVGLASCEKELVESVTPKIIEDKVEVTTNSAVFNWKVEWVGKRVSVVELSENEEMSFSNFYGSEEELNKEVFTVSIGGLKPNTRYYYRYWVWNQQYLNNEFVMEKSSFTTLAEAIDGLFSVSGTEKVSFSKGNLQYIGSAATPYWKFADHQWAVLGNGSQASAAPNVDRDLFGWGTSGYHDGGDPYNVNYQPYSTSTSTVNSSYNYYGYGPSTNQSNPNIAGTHYDWGVHNKIANGGNQAGLWRTLTKAEWVYVFNTREASTVNGTPNARYAKAQVNGIHGMILFPDSYTHPSGVSAPFGINETGDTGWNYNVYGAEDWSKMEEQGCVFLPAAGYRNGTSVNNVGSGGYYWSASYYSEGNAYDVWFNDSNLSPQSYNMRDNGQSVRLVRSAQ